ncbi:hypothetical protein [Streptomyces sp. NPDC004042]|uniref:hypothetical protein n=1 Tax=Streptomyces sp. NPDC004042 TaxID=3154451 RepID=UPI0033AFCCD2
MTRTMKSGTGTTGTTGSTGTTGTLSRRRVAVTGALGLASIALAAVPAHAKGEVDLTAPRTAAVGKTITVSASGSDDAAVYQRICLEDRTGEAAWHQVACGATVSRDAGAAARATARVKAAHRGGLQFRAVMYGLTSAHDKHPVRWRTSDVATVQVR